MTVFKAANALTFDTVQGDTRRLAQHLAENPDALCLDLSEVRFCDSAGLAFLIEAKRRSTAVNAQFEIKGMSKTIAALAAFCGVEGILEKPNG